MGWTFHSLDLPVHKGERGKKQVERRAIMMTPDSIQRHHERAAPGTAMRTVRTQCGSILLMVFFFVCGSLLSPLHILWRDEQNSTRYTRTNNMNYFRDEETSHVNQEATPFTADHHEPSEGNGETDVSQSTLPLKLAPVFQSSVASASSAGSAKDDTILMVESGNPITTPQTNFSGILARPFEPWTHQLPCFKPDNEWSTPETQKYPANRGFLYLKVRMHAGDIL